ncbi:bacteriophage abortive infection AbiH family protein [Bifidobacterium asteroides]|uniref:bacteriophage abortive infection AbiH family protein n=1 Tax=Bifidobacterium asteroides TaxID=1684 RepID=UPI003A80F1B3
MVEEIEMEIVMGRLYIIGNGFDILHGLNTSWENFITSPSGQLWHSDMFESPDDLEHPWADLERNLGRPNVEEILGKFESAYREVVSSSNPDDVGPIEPDNLLLENVLNVDINEYGALSEHIKEWISNIDLDEDFCTVPNWPSHDDLFITFNYTMTLEKKYAVKANRVCHIHGSTASGEIIVGHGPKTKVRGLIDKESEEYAPYDINPYVFQKTVDDQINKAAESIGKSIISITEKNLDAGFEALKSFLININKQTVDEIIVIGHSLGEADTPYIRKIAQVYPQAKWTITYHGSTSLKEDTRRNSEMRSRAENNGIPKNRLTIITPEKYFMSL